MGRRHKTRVLEDQHNEVDGSQEETVRGNQLVGVAKDQTVRVGGMQNVRVTGQQNMNVDGLQNERVFEARRVVEKDESVFVFGSRYITVHGGEHSSVAGPSVSNVRQPDPPTDPDEKKTYQPPKFLEEKRIDGSRYQKIAHHDEFWVHDRASVVEDSDKLTIEKNYTVNVGQSVNFLVTGLKDPDDKNIGLYMDKTAIRLGTHARSAEEIVLFRGRDAFHLGKDGIAIQSEFKDIEIRVGDTGCSLKFSADGKHVTLVGLESIELRGKESSIKIGDDIVIDAGSGQVKLKGSAIQGG